jgi:serine/threonine protein kinase/tetratricopeptide (TPR) repeat protein
MLQCPACGRLYESGVTKCPEDGALLRADETVAGRSAADPLIGLVLDDKYRLDERLGEGGMGTVYSAMHLLIERPVAVKVLNPRLVTDEAARERLRREARAAGRLQHSNAVAVTDFGETREGLVYVVMELLEGRSLRDVLMNEAPLDPARAVSIMLQVSAAVAAAHEAGIIHRDLKPGNIFIVQRPHAPHIVKVLDFGIAKIAEESGEYGQVNTLTGTGVMIGTPRYMSPEQCDGGPLTPASDVYSLGVILYEMLTGQTPFSGATPLALALKHSSELPRRLTEIVPNVPPALEGVALHALEKSPDERPADAGAFRRALYDVAERLGLEHSAGFSAPTVETLRGAGTETPSGRLVIDLERLRQNRAAQTREAPAASNTAEDGASQTAGKSGGRPAPGESQHAAAPTPHARARHARRRSSRVRVPVGDAENRPLRLRGAGLLVAVALGALVVGGGVYLLYRLAAADRQTATEATKASESDESIGRTLGGADVTPRARPASEPRSAAEFYERGAYYFSSRNFDGAVRDYRRALELQPEFPEAHNRLGRVLMLQGRFGEAAAEFRRAVEQKGGPYAAAQYNLGFALQSRGDMNEAIEAYNAAVGASGGKYPDAFFQIGLAHLNRRRFAEAADSFRRAIEQNGGRDPEAQNQLGFALAMLEDFAGAETAFHAAIDGRGGDYAEARYRLGMLYAEAGRTQEAIGEFETFLRQETSQENRRRAESVVRELRQKLAREGGGRQ